MEEPRKIDLTQLPVKAMLSEIQRHLSAPGENLSVTLILRKAGQSQNGSGTATTNMNFVLFNQEDSGLKSFHSSIESRKQLMKLSNRMGSTMFRSKDSMNMMNSALPLDDKTNKPMSSFDSLLSKCQYYYQQRIYDMAIDALTNVEWEELEDSQRCTVSFYLGNCLFRVKNYTEAIEAYTREQFPAEEEKQKGQRYNNLASCYAKLKKYELSLQAYNEAIKIYSKYPEIDCSNLLNNVGIIYMGVNMFRSAQKFFIDSIEERKLKSPTAVDLLSFSYTKLAICQSSDNRYEQAIENFLIALNWAERGQGDMEVVLKELAFCCEKLKRWSEALDYYQKLSYSSRNQGFILQKVSLIHRNLGHKHEFQKFLKQAMNQYKKQGNERKISELNNIARANGLQEIV